MRGAGRFALRAGVGLGVLGLFPGLWESMGINLGINPVNGALLGLLGAPGFGLLLLLNWFVR